MNYYEMTQVRNEQVKDWLRDAEHDRLVRQALKGRAAGAQLGLNTFGWSGISFLAAGLLFVVAALAHLPATAAMPSPVSSSGRLLANILLLTALMLVVWGLVGLHIRQRKQAGRIGLAGFALALGGALLLAGSIFAELFVLPLLAPAGEPLDSVESLLRASVLTPPVLIVGAGLYLGYLLVGLARLRAGRLPFHAGLVLSVGAQAAVLVSLLAPTSMVANIGVIVCGLGFMVLGVVLISRPGRVALQQPA